MDNRVVENVQLVSGFVPVEMDAGANNGDWVSLKDYHHIAVVFFAAAGTAGDDPTLTIKQATDVSGTGAKALNFTDIYTKQGTLTAVGTYTKVTQASGNTYTDLTSAEVQKIWIVEFNSDQLDVEGGFDCVQASVADIGANSQLGCCMYALSNPRFAGANLPSAIVD